MLHLNSICKWNKLTLTIVTPGARRTLQTDFSLYAISSSQSLLSSAAWWTFRAYKRCPVNAGSSDSRLKLFLLLFWDTYQTDFLSLKLAGVVGAKLVIMWEAHSYSGRVAWLELRNCWFWVKRSSHWTIPRSQIKRVFEHGLYVLECHAFWKLDFLDTMC